MVEENKNLTSTLLVSNYVQSRTSSSFNQLFSSWLRVWISFQHRTCFFQQLWCIVDTFQRSWHVLTKQLIVTTIDCFPPNLLIQTSHFLHVLLIQTSHFVTCSVDTCIVIVYFVTMNHHELTLTRLATALDTASTGRERSGIAFPSSASSWRITSLETCSSVDHGHQCDWIIGSIDRLTWTETGSKILSIVLVWKTGMLIEVAQKWTQGLLVDKITGGHGYWWTRLLVDKEGNTKVMSRGNNCHFLPLVPPWNKGVFGR